MLDRQPFRFAGANIDWLALDDSTNYPSQFRVNDALDAAKEMGLTVICSPDLGISSGCPNCIEPSLDVFNETALEHVDYVIKAAADRGLRLIIPLTDNWRYPAEESTTLPAGVASPPKINSTTIHRSSVILKPISALCSTG